MAALAGVSRAPSPPWWRRLAGSLAGLESDAGLVLATGSMVVFGLFLRAQRLGYPRDLVFDEHHFVKNARNYLSGAADWNDHPPLGKLLIAGGIKLVGDSSLAWRLAPLCFGALSIVLAYALGRQLFKSRDAGLIAAAFMALDGFFISYSRAAMLDGMLASLMLAAGYAAVSSRKWWHVLMAALLVGLAASMKFSGIMMGGVVVLVTLVLGRAPRWSVICLLAAPVVYYLVFAVGLSMVGREATPGAVLAATQKLATHHLGLTEMKHPLTSSWYTWLIPLKPIMISYSPVPGGVRAMTSLGNPLIWWGVSLTVIGTALGAVVAAVWRLVALLSRRNTSGVWPGFFGTSATSAVLLLIMWAMPLAPWVFTKRDSYIYHYLPAYGFGIVLLAGAVAAVYERRRLLGLVVVLLIAEVGVFYAPLWGQFPLTQRAVERRLMLGAWRR